MDDEVRELMAESLFKTYKETRDGFTGHRVGAPLMLVMILDEMAVQLFKALDTAGYQIVKKEVKDAPVRKGRV